MYSRYSELKRSISKLEYKKYNMGKMLAPELVQYAYSKNKLIFLLKAMIRSVYVVELSAQIKNLLPVKSAVCLYTIFLAREDYNQFLDAAISKNKSGNNQKIELFGLNRRIVFKPALFFIGMKYVSSIEGGVGSLEKVLLFFLFVRAFYQINDLESIGCDLNVGSYVAFNSSFGLETYLTQFFINKGTVTYSLQHGMYQVFKSDIPIDVINYENIVADHLLCWGEYTYDELIDYGVDKSVLVLSGNPLYDVFKPNVDPRSFKSCVVFLARSSYETGNKKLLNVLSECLKGVDISLKLHPALDCREYQEILDTYDASNIHIINDRRTSTELLSSNQFDFVITYNTTVLYQSVTMGMPSLSFGYMVDGSIVLDDFETCGELLCLIKEYKCMDVDKLNEKLKCFSKYTMGDEAYQKNYCIS